MALKLTWRPVLEPLELQAYHPDFAGNVIEVCVNPQPTVWQARVDLMNEYARRLEELQIKPGQKLDEEKAQAFATWAETEYNAAMNAWFAVLWSHGAEKFTADDLVEYDQLDPHLVTWLKVRSIDMVNEHRTGRKKK